MGYLVSKSRREFIRRMSATVAAGGVSAFLPQLGLMGQALASTKSSATVGYRALVCVYLGGGNDAFNLLVPGDARYDGYLASRGGLYNLASNPQGLCYPLVAGDPVNNLSPLLPLTPTTSGSYAVNPACPELQALFNAQRLAFVANVGTLAVPITKTEYNGNLKAKPPQLFSHNDQENLWNLGQTDPNAKPGWGGLTADLIKNQNSSLTALSPCISIGGANRFEIGTGVVPYQMTAGSTPTLPNNPHPSGATQLSGYTGTSQFAAQRLAALNELLGLTYNQPLTDEYKRILDRSIDLSSLLTSLLSAGDGSGDIATVFPDAFTAQNRNSLAEQLRMVARMIKISRTAQIGHVRQIYYVRLGGFDTHTAQIAAPSGGLGASQAAYLQRVSRALGAFYDALIEIGAESEVLTFTMSEFSRTLSSNGDGTDHAWGGIQLVMGQSDTTLGGSLKGGQVYGTFPELALDGPDSLSRGQFVPTTAVAQMMAPLASWMGVQPGDLGSVFPNLSQFPSGTLPFLA